MFDRKLVLLTVLSLIVNGFAPIWQRKSLQDVTDPYLGPDGVDPDVYGRTSGQESTFCYMTNAQACII